MLTGLTEREVEVVTIPDCTSPSDHVSRNGGVPVSVTGIDALEPAQIVWLPEMLAVGICRTLTIVVAAGDVQPPTVVETE